MDGTQELEVLHVFETYAIGNGGFCRDCFCAQAFVKVSAGALHRRTGKTKQNANKEVVHSRENCGVVDRQEINEKKIERKPRLKKIKNCG